MAVYTHISTADVQLLATRLGLGEVAALQGVAAGVENTTYFFVCGEPPASAEYVLTIAETIDRSELGFIAGLCQLLADQHLPVPAPVADSSGTAVFELRGKAAIVVPKALGSHPTIPSPGQCEAIGKALAHLHTATQRYAAMHESHRSLHWVTRTGNRLLSCLDKDDQALLAGELRFIGTFMAAADSLPQAVIHGDLFRDNTLFIGDKLTAIIDFFSAGTGFLLFDLAVVANDWCRADDIFSSSRLAILTRNYAAIRAPSRDEIEAWPQLLRIAALRFWVSRLAEAHLGDGARPRGEKKDPGEYRNLLVGHREKPLRWPSV